MPGTARITIAVTRRCSEPYEAAPRMCAKAPTKTAWTALAAIDASARPAAFAVCERRSTALRCVRPHRGERQAGGLRGLRTSQRGAARLAFRFRRRGVVHLREATGA